MRKDQTWAGCGWFQLPRGMAEPTDEVAASRGNVLKTLKQLRDGGITVREDGAPGTIPRAQIPLQAGEELSLDQGDI